MHRFGRDHTKSILLIGVWVNRNWILGNWIREIQNRNPKTSEIHWVGSVFARKHFWERFLKFPLPTFGAYFFSYPTIFESYLRTNTKKYRNRSIVNYTHNLPELGDLIHQVKILNQAHSVHFNCSADADALVSHGLDKSKVRIVFGAIDDDCRLQPGVEREANTILLASRFGDRKGLDVFPEVVKLLPDWKFIILGRGWEKFLQNTKLFDLPNIEYQYFNKSSRNIAMSRATIFLSLSKLEGGPIPLLEAMSMGVIPVATDTGFAPDLIKSGINGLVITNPPTGKEIADSILMASKYKSAPQNSVQFLNWDRLSNIVITDATEIWNSEPR